MCNFLSAIVTISGEIICKPEVTDSHEDLIALLGLRDDGLRRGFVRVEFTPPLRPADISDVSAWKLTVDEAPIPDWFDRERVHDAMKLKVKDMFITDNRTILLGGCWILTGHAFIKRVVNARIPIMLNDSVIGESLQSSRVGVMRHNSTIIRMDDVANVGVMRDFSSVNYMYNCSSVQEMWNASSIAQMHDYSHVGVMAHQSAIGMMGHKASIRKMDDTSKVGTMDGDSRIGGD